jgi:hypothetical protein
MSTLTRTGYEKDNIGSWISKDPEATLIYSMDWSEWLPENAVISAVTYTLQVRANDPEPLVKGATGISQSNTVTFVELSGGQLGKTYTVTAEITTDTDLVDRRSFRIKVENRSA